MKNKIVLITGGNTGIGLEIVKKFAKNGAIVLFTYFEDREAAGKLVAECRNLGASDAICFFLDLKNDENIKNLVAEIKQKYNQFDILINNAALKFSALLTEQTTETITDQLRTDLEGLIKITKEFLPMIKYSIVNVGSALALEGAKKNLTVYCAAKYGVRGFTKSLARECPDLKIYVVNPSLTATRMGHFQGMPPTKTAEIIFKAANGEYSAKSGSDINVRDYRFNGLIRFFLPVLRIIKKMIRFDS